MNLYIINCEISDDVAKHLLDHLTLYNGQVCDIIEVINTNVQDIKSGYLSKLTIGKVKHQENKAIDYYIKHDLDDVIYYLVQTRRIKLKDIFKICTFNASKCLHILLDQGINVNIQDDYGWTSLHFACRYNRVEIVKLLLDNGINANIQDNHGWTPLHWVCVCNSVEAAKLLLNNGTNINMQNNYGTTPLHFACENNSVEIVKLLMDNGANVNIQNNWGNTPLQTALKHNFTECIKLLQPL